MNEELTHLDIFSGIGGFALAAKWAGFRTIAFCEIDKYCQKVLAKNFGAVADTAISRPLSAALSAILRGEESARSWHGEPQRRSIVHSNIFDFNGTRYQGCDLLTGGFPCQPFSVAGKRRGAADDRHLWPEMLRVINEARPAWVLGENVPGIIPMELDNVLSDLESIGYTCRPFVIPACAVDARHRRDRLWIVCRKLPDANEQGLQGRNGSVVRERASERTRTEDSFPNSYEGGFTRGSEHDRGWSKSGWSERECRWLPESDVGRVAHGIPSRVDRLKGLGNAIVPQVAYQILKAIKDSI